MLYQRWYSLFFLGVFLCYQVCLGFPPINLFRPSDRPLMPEPLPCWGMQFTVGYEGAVNVRGFRDDGDECLQTCIKASTDIEKKTNVLHIYQNPQNALAGLKGFDSLTSGAQLGQRFNINDENGTQGIFSPCGDLHIPLNLMLSHRFYFDYGLNLGLHLPIYSMELNHVRWRARNPLVTSEQVLAEDLLAQIRDVSGLHLGGWKRTGYGDFLVQLSWLRDFMQARPLLSNVRTQLRLGALFPTGKKADEDRILAFAFGNDGSYGLQFAGGIDLTFCYTMRGGIDVQFDYLFGSLRDRRIKTQGNQTDLFFFTKRPTFREFGLQQQYNVYVESRDCISGLSLKANYQFLKRNDDRLSICSDRVDPIIVNTAENVQDWTAHSLIFMAGYDFCRYKPYSPVIPSILGWFKWGFNGKRAILLNTVGLQLTLSF